MTNVTLLTGDCRVELPKLAESSIDTCITDPPYGLGFMGVKWDTYAEPKGSGPTGKHSFDHVGGNHNPINAADRVRTHAKENANYQAWCAEWLREVYRVLKPGAFLLCFGGTRTFHRIACAIEETGLELRDCIMWVYGSGFPKSHDISKAIDKAAGAKRQVIGPKANQDGYVRTAVRSATCAMGKPNDAPASGVLTAPATDAAKLWDGWGTALKPAWEPIIVAMKPTDGTFAENALRHGVAGLNIDGARIATDEVRPKSSVSAEHLDAPLFKLKGGCPRSNGCGANHASGRFPANLVLDEEAGAMLDEQSGTLARSSATPRNRGTKFNGQDYNGGRVGGTNNSLGGYDDAGGASRFFYCAKASRSERGDGNNHPTVKPLTLMEYLCTLTRTPEGGVVLDPFMGSGTTILAARNTGRPAIGIELDRHYLAIVRRRLRVRKPTLFD